MYTDAAVGVVVFDVVDDESDDILSTDMLSVISMSLIAVEEEDDDE